MGDRLEWLRELREAQVTRGAKHGTVTAPVTSVTKPRDMVTKRDAGVTAGVTCPRCAELEAKVAHLTRLLASREASREPMTAAERKRLQRERAKAKRSPRSD